MPATPTGNESLYFTSISNANEFMYLHSNSGLQIYRANLLGGTAFTTVGSTAYNLNSFGNSFFQWGDDVIFVNGGVAQVCQSGGSSFIPLITSTKKPACYFCTACFNHLVMARDNVATDSVYWSAFDNPQDFQDSLVTGAGSQRIVDIPGSITGLVGGENVLVFKATGISLMTYEGSPYTFSIRTLSGRYGTKYANSIVPKGDNVYFFSPEGFKRISNRSYVEDVGQGKIESFLRAPDGSNSVTLNSNTLTGFYDYSSGMIGWTYRSQTGGYNKVGNNCILLYDESRDSWSFYRNDSAPMVVATSATYIDPFTQTIGPLSSTAFVFNNSSVYSGGAFSATTSSPYSFTTKRITLFEDTVGFVRAMRLVARMGDATVASPPGNYTIQLSSDPLFVTIDALINGSTPSNDGWIPVLGEGQFAKVTYSGGPDVTLNRFFAEIIALQFDVEPAGSAGA